MALTARGLESGDYETAIRFWKAQFPDDPPGYFEKYYAADPNYRLGDTLSVWDGATLVSTVYICRRTLSLDNQRLLCGGIANVATLPEYRGRKIAAGLLTAAIEKMIAEGFDFSLLGAASEAMPLYARHGWQPLTTLAAIVALLSHLPPPAIEPQPASVTPEVMALWQSCQRPFQLMRPPAYFTGWLHWEGGVLFLLPQHGYLLLRLPTGPRGEAYVEEWCAADDDIEQSLLTAAASYVQRRGMAHLKLAALPQFGGLDALATLGTPSLITRCSV